MRFRVLPCCVNELEYFWTFNMLFQDPCHINSTVQKNAFELCSLGLVGSVCFSSYEEKSNGGKKEIIKAAKCRMPDS